MHVNNMWNWFRLAFLNRQDCTAEEFSEYVVMDAKLRGWFRIPLPSRKMHDGYHRTLEKATKKSA